MRLGEAWRALRALARSGGKDVRQAATFINATEGRAGQRAFVRLQASEQGAALLRERPALRAWFDGQRAALAQLPPGTLGRVCHDFMAIHGFSAEGLAELRVLGGERPMTEAEHWFAERASTLHDIRHVVAGYGQEPLGELCLLAFRFAHLRHPGMGFFCIAWGLKMAREQRAPALLRAVLEGYRRGRAARWMDDLPWETMMAEPLAAVRQRLGVTPPTVYAALRIRSGVPAEAMPLALAEGPA